MAARDRTLPLILALLLAITASSAAAQDAEMDGGGLGGAIAAVGDAMDAIVDAVDPSDPDSPIDPSDPDSPIDPSDPDSPIDPEPGEPGSNEPDEPADGGDDSGIELPEPAEPEDGGFREIQLIPDPVPRAGRWTATNKKGLFACDSGLTQRIKPSTQSGRISVRDEGRVLTGRSLARGQQGTLTLRWDPNTNRYRGSVRAAAEGGTTRISFTFRVVDDSTLKGELIGKVRVSANGQRYSCTVSREITLRRGGRR